MDWKAVTERLGEPGCVSPRKKIVTLSPIGELRELGVIGEPGTLVPGLIELIGYWYYTHGFTPVARLLVILYSLLWYQIVNQLSRVLEILLKISTNF